MDLTGGVFERLTVLGHAGKNKWGQALFECECSCIDKTVVIVVGSSLRSRNTRSCGCLQREVGANSCRLRATHGASKRGHVTKEYSCWASIKDRCYNPNSKKYKDYGGRGIVMCDRWKDSFENFYQDMGLKPSSKHSIDRVNNHGNYELSNCRWATHIEQNNNKRNNIMIGNETLAEVCRKKDLPYSIVSDRIHTLDWSIEDALNIPIKKRNKKHD